MIKVSIDFETFSECDIRSAGAWAYATDASTRVLCMAYAYEDQPVQLWAPGQPLPDFMSGDITNYHIHAWNSFFEWVVWTKVMKLPAPPITQWTDTAALACAMALPRALGQCGAALKLPQNLQKNKRGYYLIRALSIPNKLNGDPVLTQEMYQYCKDDVTTEREISKRLYKLNPTERKVWELDQTINIRGIKVDKPTLGKALNVYDMAQADLKGRLKEITGLDNPNSQKQFLGWLQDKGVSVENTQKPTLLALLELEDPHGVHTALKLKMSLSKTAPKKFHSMRDKIGAGTRLHGNVMYHGASTGRWSSTGVNLQNIARPTLDADWCIKALAHEDLALFEMTDTDPMEALSSSVRGMLIPEDGHKFIVGDYSSIEARALAWLTSSTDKLEIFKGDGLIYEDAASKIFKVPVADVTKQQRFLGKISELACGYQGGAGAFKLMAQVYGVDIPHKEAEKIKQQWRKANEKIVQFWYDCDKAVSTCIQDGKVHTVGKVQYGVSNNFLMCKLPSGRKLYYYHPKVSYKKVVCYKIPATETDPELTFIYHPAEYPSLKAFYASARKDGVEPYEFNALDVSFWGVDSTSRKFKQLTTYGGKLVENITQAVARDIMAESMLQLEGRGYPIVLTVHDEIISEVSNGTVEEFTSIMEETPRWAEGLPIKVEAYEASRYRK
jgi:DNA polymerase|tara:strand:+ start:68 stop:2077 length:2010 start_codon:yes stop_codon:yes gene_type:complete